MGRNNAGFIFTNVGIITLFLAAAGAWYVHRAYTTGSLKNDIGATVSDGKKNIVPHLVGQQEAPIGENFSLPKGPEAMRKLLGPSQLQSSMPLSTVSPAPVQGVYYGR